jgi:hypothetical protein
MQPQVGETRTQTERGTKQHTHPGPWNYNSGRATELQIFTTPQNYRLIQKLQLQSLCMAVWRLRRPAQARVPQ